jgi:hypothetical protein
MGADKITSAAMDYVFEHLVKKFCESYNADMLICGYDNNNMKYDDTLSDDKIGGYTFDYITY